MRLLLRPPKRNGTARAKPLMQPLTATCAVLLCLAPSGLSHAAPADRNSRLATVSLVDVPAHKRLLLDSGAAREFVLVALSDCSILVNGKSVRLKSGEHTTVLNPRRVLVSQSGAKPLPLVLVKVLSSRQELTVVSSVLAPRQVEEDASSRNATLLIAVDAAFLRDERNAAAPDRGWLCGAHSSIALSPGRFVWLAPGEHRISNLEDLPIRFVTVEW